MRTKIFIVGIVALVFSVATFLVHAQGKEYKELTYAIVGAGQLVAYDDHGPIPMPEQWSFMPSSAMEVQKAKARHARISSR